jgi:hypothetical protein
MFFKIYGEVAKQKTKNTTSILFLQRELIVFTVIGKAIELKSIDYRFDSCLPHKYYPKGYNVQWENVKCLQ